MSFVPTKMIGALIDSVSDDGAFAELPVKLAKFANTASTQIQIQNAMGATTLASHGISNIIIENYGQHFWRHDVWAIGYVNAGFKSITTSENFIRDSEFLESEFYNDLLKPENDFVRCLGFTETISDGSTLLLGMHRTRTQPQYEAEAVSAMRALHPSIVHLVEARRRIAAGRGRIAEHLVDAEPDATMVVSRAGELKFMNPSAKQLLANGGLLSLSGRFLTSKDTGLATWLRIRVADAVAGRGGGVRTVIDSLGRRYRFSVDRLEGANDRLTCVRVRDEQAALNRRIEAARTNFSLTFAEAQLAEALLKGATPAQFAIAKGVRIPTVRSQLRSLFAKAGVAGQNELLIVLNFGAPGESR